MNSSGDQIWAIAISVALVAALTSSAPTSSPDSGSYLLSGPGSFGQFSFTGQSLRPWPSVLPFLLGPHIGITFQYILYGFACFLFLISLRSISTSPRIHLLQLAAFVFLLSRNNLQWQSSVLSEGCIHSLTILSISSTVLFFANEEQFRWAFLACVSSSVLMLVRPSSLPLAIALILACILKVAITRKGVAAFVLLATSFSLTMYSFTVGDQTNDYWKDVPEVSSYGATRLGMHFGYLTAEGRHDALEIASQLRRSNHLFETLESDPNVPSCLTTIRAEYGCPHCLSKRLEEAGCSAGIAWANERFLGWYARFLASNPGYVLDTAIWAIGWQSSFRMGGHTPWSPVPEIVERLTTGFASPFPFPIIGFWYAAVLYLLVKRIFCADSARTRWDLTRRALLPLIIWCGSAFSIVFSALLMNFDVGRISRFGGISSVMAVILLAAVLDLQKAEQDL